MAFPLIGVGALIANDILTDCAFKLLEPCVNATVPSAFGGGPQTILIWDNALYVGALLVVGKIGGNAEVVTVLAVNPGTSFSATFASGHFPGDPIVGATFPVQRTAGDFFFSQQEMLTYLSNAVNDFLNRVALVYSISTAVVFGPTTQVQPLPADCQLPVRVAASQIALRETSQANLDGVNYRWNSAALSTPYAYYRDKIGLQNIGIWPRQANTVPTEIVYVQRGPALMGLADGFILPDVFLPIVKARVMEFALSKDGEQRAPAVAQFWNMRYENGVKIAGMILELAMDANDQ
jgi:hypothetical protein